MTHCSRCQTETEMYVNGIPICIACANEIEGQIPLPLDVSASSSGECRTSVAV